MEGTKKIKSMSFHQYLWNSEVEATWISLNGRHHKTSSIYSQNIFIVELDDSYTIVKSNLVVDSFYLWKKIPICCLFDPIENSEKSIKRFVRIKMQCTNHSPSIPKPSFLLNQAAAVSQQKWTSWNKQLL